MRGYLAATFIGALVSLGAAYLLSASLVRSGSDGPGRPGSKETQFFGALPSSRPAILEMEPPAPPDVNAAPPAGGCNPSARFADLSTPRRAGLVERTRPDAPPGRVLVGKAVWKAECIEHSGLVRLRLSAAATLPDFPPAELAFDFILRENEYLVAGLVWSVPKSDRVRLLDEPPELRRRGAKTGRAIAGTLSREQDRLTLGPGTSSLWTFSTAALLEESQWIDLGVRMAATDYTLTVELPSRPREGASTGRSVQ